MKRIAVAFILFCAAALVAVPASAGDYASRIETVRSPGGIEAWLVREPGIPMLALEATWRNAGSSTDPASREGMASMVANMLDEGAGEFDADGFKSALNDRAISLNYSADRDGFRISLKTLSEERGEAFRLLGLSLSKPRFDAEPMERVRGQMLIALKRAETNPSSLTGRAWYSTAFPNHAYGRDSNGTEASLRAMTADDLRAWLSNRLAKRNLIVGVVGDITPEALGALLDRAFGALPESSATVTVADAQVAAPGPVKVVQLANPQSQVLFGGPGIARKDPDWYAANIINYVLGGNGLNSRLATEVREKRGLAYSVYTYMLPYDHAAIHMGSVATRNDAVAESIRLIKAEMARMRDEGLSAEDIKRAKAYLTGSFPLRLDSNGAIAGMLVSIQYNGLGANFIDRYAEYINAVTPEDIRRVAKRLLDPERLIIVVTGQPVGLGG